MKTLKAAMAACLLSFAASAASAVSFSDDFQGDTIAVPTGSLVNWDITGSVDVVGPNRFGYLCLDGSKCVDMDGNSPGRIDTKTTFTFLSGTIYTLAFDYNSNGNDNGIAFGITGGLFTDQLTGVNETPNVPYRSYSTTFMADGMGKLFFDSDSNSNSPNGLQGVILDNVSLIAAPVPLPAGLPLLAAGLCALGIACRRALAKA